MKPGPRRARRAGWLLATCLFATVAVAAGAGSAPAYPRGEWLQRAAEAQLCLEESLATLQVESTVGRDGRSEEVVQVTRWGAADMAGVGASAPRADCTSAPGAPFARCGQDDGVRRVVPLDIRASEVQASWPANDRARPLRQAAPATSPLRGRIG